MTLACRHELMAEHQHVRELGAFIVQGVDSCVREGAQRYQGMKLILGVKLIICLLQDSI